MTTSADDLTLALTLADLADEITIARFRASDLVIETKPDLTPVTEADRAVEQLLRERLAQARPDDAVVGEEYGSAGSGPRRWIVDPIDGTKNYVRGVPVWATLLALEADGQVTVAVASAPALHRRWWARRGEGAFLDDGLPGVPRRLSVSGVRELKDAQCTLSGIEDWDAIGRRQAMLELTTACWRNRGFGDLWSYMLVAEGAMEVASDPEASLWDLAAPQLIVEEAGGRFTDLGGHPRADGGSGVGTNGHVHDAVLAILGG
jgi:histidinol-phosphatase